MAELEVRREGGREGGREGRIAKSIFIHLGSHLCTGMLFLLVHGSEKEEEKTD